MDRMLHSWRRRFLALPVTWSPGHLVTWLLLAVAGCGQQQIYPVHGQVVDPDGNPVTELKGGTVEFENPEFHSSALGVIEADGSFWLTTRQPRDGAFLGKNLVCVSRPYATPEQRAPYVILPKYDSFTTSGLAVTVEPKHNEVRLTVERVRGRRGGRAA